MNPLSGILTPQIRKRLYALHAAFSGALVCIGAYYTSTDAPVPNWLKGLTGVAVAAGTLLGLTAASNVPTPDTDEPGGGEAGEVLR